VKLPCVARLAASLKDDTARMNDRIKHKEETGQMNHQTTDPKANATGSQKSASANALFHTFVSI